MENNKVINLQVNQDKIIEFATKQAAKELVKQQKKEKRLQSQKSHTEILVEDAIKDFGIKINGKGDVLDDEGNYIKNPLDFIQIYFDRNKDSSTYEKADVRFFNAFLNQKRDQIKKIEHAKLVDEIGVYTKSNESEIEKLARIMLEGKDFEKSENKKELFIFKWGLENRVLQIKRKIHNLDIFDHKVLGFIGIGSQGDQKTEMVRRLLKPLGCFHDTLTLSDLLDQSRNYERFTNNYALFIDDMHACPKKDTNDVKTMITAKTISPRILGGHTIITVPVRATFDTTSNTPLNLIFKDTEGSRRFLDINVTKDLDRTRFMKLNNIDWKKIYTEVKYDYTDQETLSYLKVRDEIICPFQNENSYKDFINEFFEDRCITKGSDFVEISNIYDELINYAELKRNRDRLPSRQQFSTRLVSLGLERIKRDKSGVFIDKNAFTGAIKQ